MSKTMRIARFLPREKLISAELINEQISFVRLISLRSRSRSRAFTRFSRNNEPGNERANLLFNLIIPRAKSKNRCVF